MKTSIAFLLVLVFAVLAGIHIYWGFGGKKLKDATIPTKTSNIPVIKPGAFDCLAVAVVLFGFGFFISIKSRFILWYLPQWLLQYGLWVISAIFLLRAVGEFRYIGFFKKIKETPFGQMDSKYYSPLCLLIAVLSIALQIIMH